MPADIPIDTVLGLRQQGLSNNQIIQELQRQGYHSQQIFDAINTAEPANTPATPVDIGVAPQEGIPQERIPQPTIEETALQQAPSPEFDYSKEKIEEMAEAIIDEKWEELVKSINKIIEWKDKMDATIHKLEQEMKDLKENFDQLHSSMIGKIKEYDRNIVNVGTEVKAMEKVFEKVLPTFTENVGELRRIIKGTKGTKK